MINIDTHFFLEARHVDFMTTIKERSWFANTTNHDAFRTVSNLLWAFIVQTSRSWGQHLCSKFAKITHVGCAMTFKVPTSFRGPPPSGITLIAALYTQRPEILSDFPAKFSLEPAENAWPLCIEIWRDFGTNQPSGSKRITWRRMPQVRWLMTYWGLVMAEFIVLLIVRTVGYKAIF